LLAGSALATVTGMVTGIVGLGTGDFSVAGQTLMVATVVSSLGTGAFVYWHQRRGRPSGGIAKVLVVVSSLMVALLAVSTFARWPVALQAAKPIGQFDTPGTGEDVESPVDLSGTASLPSDWNLWLLIQPPNNRLYTTSDDPILVDERGEWQLQGAGVGRGDRDAGRTFTFMLAASPKNADGIANALRTRPAGRRSAELPALPSGAVALDRVRVSLAGWR
jgi:hypothetical protein